eukprot:4154057-Prorocentrum_lima.AAC.1
MHAVFCRCAPRETFPPLNSYPSLSRRGHCRATTPAKKQPRFGAPMSTQNTQGGGALHVGTRHISLRSPD